MKNWQHEPIYWAPSPKLGGGWIAHKDSPSPPATPDYAGAAQAQGAANVETARTQGRMNNPNIYTPYGSQTVEWGTGAPVFNEQAYNQALQQYQNTARTAPPGALTNEQGQFWDQSTGAWASPSGPTGTAPTREQFTTTPLDDQPIIRQTLAPAQQALLDAQNRISGNLAGVAETGLNRVSQGMATPFDTSGLPQAQTNVQGGNYQSNVGYTPMQSSYNQGGQIRYDAGFNQPIQNSFNPGGNIQQGVNFNQAIQGQIAPSGQQQTGFDPGGNVRTSFDTAGQQQTQLGDVGGPQRGLDFSGAPDIPGINDFGRERDLVTNALLSRTEPQFQRDEELTRTRLINQGIAPGAEASNYDLDTLNRARNDARQQAILAGSQEQSRLANLAMAARGQYTGELAQQGAFANNAQNQAFSQGLAGGQFANQAQQAQYAQNLGAMQATNAAQAQQYAQNQGLANFANQAQQNQFGQNLAAGQFANTAQGQGYNQAANNMSLANAAQAQQFGQNQGLATFGNAAQAQGYGQAQGNLSAYNAAQAQANAQNQSAAQFANQAAQGNFGMGQQNAALQNQVAQQQFQQGLANANLSNQSRQQAIQEQAYMRQLPLNELNALRTGAQVQNPQFQPYQGANIGQTPIFQAAQLQGQADQNIYNQQAGSANSFNTGLMNLLGTAGGIYARGGFSDRRLKSNINRIGTHPLGIGIYEYDIFGARTTGVMADELESVMPEAVMTHGSGYKFVDYGML